MAKEASVNDFGLLIAYLLPGFTVLLGIAQASAPVRTWLGASTTEPPTVAGLLYVTVASIGAGLTVSTVRWLLIDSLHHATGIRPPHWHFAALRESPAAFALVVDHYYRYYQFYANMLIALLGVLLARRWSLYPADLALGPPDVGLLALSLLFFLGSRDSLRRYYVRGGQLLARQQRRAPRRKSIRDRASSGHQIPKRDAEGAGELLDIQEGDIPQPPLDG